MSRTSIDSRVRGALPGDRAAIKAAECELKTTLGLYSSSRYGVDVEIVGKRLIDNGIEILARAFKSGSQLGFGAAGDIDVERFRIYNPPVLIRDPAGSILRTDAGIDGEPDIVTAFSDDTRAAIRDALAHTISVVPTRIGRVVPGRIGSTVSTFHPEAGTTEPVDGFVRRQIVDESFATIRTGAGNDADATAGTNALTRVKASTTTDQYSQMLRSVFGFDTSAITNDDTIQSATLSFEGSAVFEELSADDVAVDRNPPASTSALANSDYDLSGWDAVEQSTARISLSSWNTTGYNDFTLNSTGIGNINKTGLTWFGLRMGSDFDNSAPTWSSSNENRAGGRYADVAGASSDPKLVVTHVFLGLSFQPRMISLIPEQIEIVSY